MNPLFYGRKKSDTKPLIYHAWDCETRGLGGELLCITTCPENPSTTFYYDGACAIDAFLEQAFLYYYTKKEKHVWVSHNMSYDMRYIVEYVINHLGEYEFGFIGMRTDSLFYAMDLKRKSDNLTIRFVDSFAVFDQKLELFAEQFGGAYKKLENPEWDERDFDPLNSRDIEYARADSACLKSSIDNYADIVYKEYGVHLGYTIAGTSLKAWQKTIPEETLYWKPSKKFSDFFREGYYGGLVFLTDTNAHENVRSYDINSSYPAQMRKGMPSGNPALTYEYIPSDKQPGFYRCKVKAPDNLRIPIIPHRSEKGLLLWTRGSFETVVTNMEIDFARKHGYEIETLEGVIFEGLEYPCNDFVDKCEAIRKEARKTPREIVAKKHQNALYGKFCTSELRDEIVFKPLISAEEYMQFADEGWVPLNSDAQDGPFYVRKTDQSEIVMAMPQWGAWITANGRLTLLRAAYDIGIEYCIYGDTDSITVKKEANVSCLELSDEYGAWKLDKEWDTFRAIAPKVYAGMQSNKWAGASKGQNKRYMKEKQYMDIYNEGKTEIIAPQLESLRQVLKRGKPLPAHLQDKKTSDILKNISYELMPDGTTRPKEI